MQEMGTELKLAAMVISGQVNRPQDLAAYASALGSAPLAEVFPELDDDVVRIISARFATPTERTLFMHHREGKP